MVPKIMSKILSRKGTIDSQILISLRSNDKVNFGGGKILSRKGTIDSQVHRFTHLCRLEKYP